jgi:hypothetical protein
MADVTVAKFATVPAAALRKKSGAPPRPSRSR